MFSTDEAGSQNNHADDFIKHSSAVAKMKIHWESNQEIPN